MVNLKELKETLNELQREAKQMGLPLARLADISDVSKVITLIKAGRTKNEK